MSTGQETKPEPALPWWANIGRYLLDKYGLPTLILIVVLYSLWQGIWKLSSWTAPKVERIVVDHSEFLKETTKTAARMAETQERQVELSEDLKKVAHDISTKVDDIHKVIVKP